MPLPVLTPTGIASPPLLEEYEGIGLVQVRFLAGLSEEVQVKVLSQTKTIGYGQYSLRLEKLPRLVARDAFVHTTAEIRAASS